MKILLVDDNAFIRKLLISILTPAGYQVDECPDAEAGMAALAAESYALVITDMVMPGKSGADFMEHIKKKKIPVPILAITGGVENAVADYVSYADLFADETMAKPVNHDEFLSTVNRLVREGEKKRKSV